MNLLFEAYKPGEIVKTQRIINTPSDFAVFQKTEGMTASEYRRKW